MDLCGPWHNLCRGCQMLDQLLFFGLCQTARGKLGFKAVPSFSACTLRTLTIWLSMITESGFEARSWNVLSNGFIIPLSVVYPLLCFFKVLSEGPPKFGLIVSGVNTPPLPIPCHIGPLIILTVLWPPNHLRVLKNSMTSGSHEYSEGVIYSTLAGLLWGTYRNFHFLVFSLV